MKPRKILIFSLVYYPRFVGGAEVAIKEITDRIPTSEIEFDMVTLRLDSSLPKNERIGNVNVHRVGWTFTHKSTPDSLPWYLHLNKYAFLLTGFLKALSLHRSREYDAIWSLMATYNSFAAVFFKIVNPRTAFIFTLQDGDPIEYIKRRALPLYPFFKMMFTRADRIQAISNYLANWARDMGARCAIDVVPNAVDISLFGGEIDLPVIDGAKNEIGKKPDDFFLVTTSRLVVKNAIGDAIESLSYLPSNVKFLIMGNGYQESDLKKKVSDLNLDGRVIFKGFVPHSDMPKYLKACDVFVRPAVSEGLGNSFLEAMACGIPVIATPVGGIPDFLFDGETGLFCEVNNPRSIALKVEKLMKDKESREYIVNKAMEMVRTRYEWGGITHKMKSVLSQEPL